MGKIFFILFLISYIFSEENVFQRFGRNNRGVYSEWIPKGYSIIKSEIGNRYMISYPEGKQSNYIPDIAKIKVRINKELCKTNNIYSLKIILENQEFISSLSAV